MPVIAEGSLTNAVVGSSLFRMATSPCTDYEALETKNARQKKIFFGIDFLDTPRNPQDLKS